jgi:hypothetical protein|tara:strand:- start:6662 stop:7564 length:903 start_codon:yes stop_codon:yes gene_type:complete
MGFGILKNLKKIVKGVGKRIRKIGRGLKKIMAKIAKPFAKLGPLGSIALGMLMPWAAGAIWTGMTGTTLTLANFGAQATLNIASKNLFTKAVGYVMKGVHWAASGVKTAYTNISTKISEGFTGLKNKAQEVFGVKADAGDLVADAVKNGPEIDATILDKNLAEQAREATLSPNATLGKPLDVSEAVSSEVSGKVAEEAVKKSFFEQAKDKAKESALGAIGTSIEGAMNPQEQTSEGGMPYIEPYNFLGDNQSYTKYNEQQTMLQNQGFSFGGPAYSANIGASNFGETTYFNWFNQYGGGR